MKYRRMYKNNINAFDYCSYHKMGVYYNSYYYPDIHQPQTRRKLGSLDPVLDASDRERGFVRKNELFQMFAKKVKDVGFGENSFIIVYVWDTYGNKEIEKERLPVLDQ